MWVCDSQFAAEWVAAFKWSAISQDFVIGHQAGSQSEPHATACHPLFLKHKLEKLKYNYIISPIPSSHPSHVCPPPPCEILASFLKIVL